MKRSEREEILEALKDIWPFLLIALVIAMGGLIL